MSFLHADTNLCSDVFLTTLKPRERVVTVEDIQSSLYYLHVDNAGDGHFLTDSDSAEAPQETHEGWRIQGRDKENRPEVFRKPLQQKPQPVWGNVLESHSVTHPHHQSTSQAQDASTPLKRKPLSSTAKFEENQRQGIGIGAASQSPTRQLLGPRPIQSRAQTSPREQPSAEKQLPELPDRPLSIPTAISTKNPPLPLGTAPPYLDSHRQRSISWSGSTTTNELSLTLIRRDPTSGGQWNVGKILSVPLGEAVPSNRHVSSNRSTRPTRRPLDVEVRTPGYVKFRSASSQVFNTSSHQYNTFTGNKRHEPLANGSALGEDGIFRRRIFFGQSVLPQHRSWRQRPGSGELSDGSVISGESFIRDKQGFDDKPPAGPSAAETQSKPQGYTFLSPWNGTCEFLTGVAGRSLICKHRLATGVAATSPSPAVTVSELRFNLPSSALFNVGQPNTATQSASRKQNRASFISRYKHRRHLSSESSYGYQALPLSEPESAARGSSIDGSDAGESKLDLSLGQEHAGGGFGGKQAKLGKLIVEDEGLKMLDLLVAANMALWWHVYERCISP